MTLFRPFDNFSLSFVFASSLALSILSSFAGSLEVAEKAWHLHNRLAKGHDVNVMPVWKEGITGKGVTICIIDDGIDFNHPDLKKSLRPELSFDFNAVKSLAPRLPTPQGPEDRHGTRCAGQIVGNGAHCGGTVGVAPGASISAIRLLGGQGRINSQSESAAVTFRNDLNDIYSCSWGPADDGQSVEGPDAAVLSAFISGLSKGRQGRGSLFVFAAGNGQLGVDNCNFDGYANAPFSLTIGAIGSDDQTPSYMEECSAMLAVTYSSDSSKKIYTTDVGSGCTDRHGGTSAAAPLAAGMMALALSIRPDLTWRDMQELLVTTALPINLDDASWIRNGAGRWFSPRFGFGKLDAQKMIEAARIWKLKGPVQIRSFPWFPVNRKIAAKRGLVLESSLNLDYSRHWKYFDLAPFKRIERVSVALQLRHGRRGDLFFILCSPAGTCVPLTTPRPKDDDNEVGLAGWTFATVAFWGEEEILGTWTLKIINSPLSQSPHVGLLREWRLSILGEADEAAPNFSEDLLFNYFPPHSDFFNDHDGVWIDQFEAEDFTSKAQGLFRQKRSSLNAKTQGKNGMQFGYLGLSMVATSIVFVCFKFFFRK